MAPFQAAGYTDTTKFKVLKDIDDLKEGDIVTLYEDNGTENPYFKTEDGRRSWCWLPNMAPKGFREYLEVYEEPKKELTPFQAAGYTDTTKFRVLRKTGILNKDDIVTLKEDDGSTSPVFNKRDLRLNWMYLPVMAAREGKPEELEVYEEPKKQKQIEYKFYPFVSKLHEPEEIESAANEIGKDGWRLSCMNDTMMIFSREVNDG